MKKFIIKLISSTMLCLNFSNIYAEETDAENSIDSLLENNSLEVSEEVQTVIENENRDIISEVDSYIISTDYNALNVLYPHKWRYVCSYMKYSPDFGQDVQILISILLIMSKIRPFSWFLASHSSPRYKP